MTTLLSNFETVFGWLLEASWQASVLALLVLFLQRVLRGRLNPRWNYALWLLVVLRLVLPVEPESVFSLFQFAPEPLPGLAGPVTRFPFLLAPTTVAVRQIHPFSLYSLCAVIWLTGAVALLLLTWEANRRFARQVRRSPEIDDPLLLNLFTMAKAELGIRRRLRLVECDQVQSPAIMGLIYPTLILPIRVRRQFSDTELRFIFLHELAHLKRGDVMVQWLIAILQILHWFNPVLWFAFRRMRADREPATDAMVLSQAGEAEKEHYGLILIKLLEHFQQRHSLPTLVGILEDKDQFKRRFSLIARYTRGAYGWSVPGVFVMTVLAVTGLTGKAHDSKVLMNEQPATPGSASSGKANPVQVSVSAVPGERMTELHLIVIEVNDDVYQANHDQIDEAIKTADLGYFNNLKESSILSEPTVTTRFGQKATMEIVRELSFPTDFERGKDGKYTPTNFQERDVGIHAELNPSEHDGKIQLSCILSVTNFDGFTFNGVSDSPVGTPTFSTKEAHLWEELGDNDQIKGVLVPGIQFDGFYHPPKGLSDSNRGVKKRLILFISAKQRDH